MEFTVDMTPEASRTWDDLAGYVETLCPLDSDYIELEVKRITRLIASDPSHEELKRTRLTILGHSFFIDTIRTSSYVDHDVAIIWTLQRNGSPIVIAFALKYLR